MNYNDICTHHLCLNETLHCIFETLTFEHPNRLQEFNEIMQESVHNSRVGGNISIGARYRGRVCNSLPYNEIIKLQ